MGNEIIDATLNQLAGIGTLTICGGEATFALNILEYIINYIIDNHIPLMEFTITINGTNYSEELLRLMCEIDKYIADDETSSFIGISFDKYHRSEMEKLNIYEYYLENIKKYAESKYFYGLRELTEKPFREGNAENLSTELTVPLRPPKKYITYMNKDKKFDKNGICFIGPIVSINTQGIITECDASDINQETIYNYGNIRDTTLEESALNHGAKILTPKRFFKSCEKEWKRYCTYNK